MINNNPIEQPLLYIYTVILYRKGNIKEVRNYFLRRYARTTSTANIMMTIICTGNYFISLSMVFLASPDSAK